MKTCPNIRNNIWFYFTNTSTRLMTYQVMTSKPCEKTELHKWPPYFHDMKVSRWIFLWTKCLIFYLGNNHLCTKQGAKMSPTSFLLLEDLYQPLQ